MEALANEPDDPPSIEHSVILPEGTEGASNPYEIIQGVGVPSFSSPLKCNDCRLKTNSATTKHIALSSLSVGTIVNPFCDGFMEVSL